MDATSAETIADEQHMTPMATGTSRSKVAIFEEWSLSGEMCRHRQKRRNPHRERGRTIVPSLEAGVAGNTGVSIRFLQDEL
jgi:hypothetical protein